jgi:integrase
MKRGDSYRIAISVGYEDGGQKKKYKTWKPSPGMSAKQIEKEVNRVAIRFEEECENNQDYDCNTTFRDFTKRWFRDYAAKNVKTNTYDGYMRIVPRINEAIGGIKLIDLKPKHIIQFLENLGEEGIRIDSKYICDVDFKAIAEKRNLSWRKIAKLSGMPTATLYRVYSYQTVAKSTVDKLCEALNLSASETFRPVGKTKLSKQSMLHQFRLISSILSTAVYWQLIPDNPCKRVKPPKSERHEAKYLNIEEAKKLIELLKSEEIQFRTYVLLLLYTGIRRGEACGLKWPDIDMDNNMINIERTLTYSPRKGIIFETPKTSSSVRTVIVSEIVTGMLREYRKWQNEQRVILGDKWANNELVFSGWNGEPEQPSRASGRFATFIKHSDLPHISLHSLRHTNASLLIAGGIDMKTVSARLGHAKMSTTSDIYTHLINSANDKAADTLDQVLS